MKFYILIEDTSKEGFEAEHGLSIYFEKNRKKFIFDLGQSNKFLKNAEKLKIKLNKIDFLVFSHGHFDHTGGLPYFQVNEGLKIICHPDCLLPKYYRKKYIGFPKNMDNLLADLKNKPFKLTKNVLFLGEIPGKRRSPLGEYVKGGIKKADFLLDDSALVIFEDDRAIIIAGCAHSGIVNIVRYVHKLFKAKKIIVVGGLHMLDYSDEEINRTIEKLKKLSVVKIFPGHCTGKKAIEELLASFSGERLYSGKIIEV